MTKYLTATILLLCFLLLGLAVVLIVGFINNYEGDSMTPARIKAIRWYLKESPHEFARRLQCDAMGVSLMENGNRKAGPDILERLARCENILKLRGINKETIDRREKRYEI